MSRFLFTMLPANDLGLPIRLAPIARVLADRGHDVAVFNPAPAPAKLIEDAGLRNLPMPSRPMPEPLMDLAEVRAAWDVDHMFGAAFGSEEFVRASTAVNMDVMRDFDADVVVDSFGLFACLAARILGVPLVSVLQGSFHPASDGFVWWKGPRPAGLPSAAAAVNRIAAENGLAPVARPVDLLAGDLSLIVGTPETDPLPAGANAEYIGPMIWQRGDGTLPDWVAAPDRDTPVIWVYSGNPRYGRGPALPGERPLFQATPIDSIVVIRAAIATFGDAPVHVVLTTGHQEMPEEVGALPDNFHHAAYLPGLAMAERCDLMVHHGGHSSVMTGLSAGTPAVIIPTITERESNARRLTALGAGEMVLPVDGADGEKQLDVGEFGAAVGRVLGEPGYRKAAQRVAESMRKYGGAREAAHRIERFAGKPGTD